MREHTININYLGSPPPAVARRFPSTEICTEYIEELSRCRTKSGFIIFTLFEVGKFLSISLFISTTTTQDSLDTCVDFIWKMQRIRFYSLFNRSACELDSRSHDAISRRESCWKNDVIAIRISTPAWLGPSSRLADHAARNQVPLGFKIFPI